MAVSSDQADKGTDVQTASQKYGSNPLAAKICYFFLSFREFQLADQQKLILSVGLKTQS